MTADGLQSYCKSCYSAAAANRRRQSASRCVGSDTDLPSDLSPEHLQQMPVGRLCSTLQIFHTMHRSGYAAMKHLACEHNVWCAPDTGLPSDLSPKHLQQMPEDCHCSTSPIDDFFHTHMDGASPAMMRVTFGHSSYGGSDADLQMPVTILKAMVTSSRNASAFSCDTVIGVTLIQSCLSLTMLSCTAGMYSSCETQTCPVAFHQSICSRCH